MKYGKQVRIGSSGPAGYTNTIFDKITTGRVSVNVFNIMNSNVAGSENLYVKYQNRGKIGSGVGFTFQKLLAYNGTVWNLYTLSNVIEISNPNTFIVANETELTTSSDASGIIPDISGVSYTTMGVHLEEHDERIIPWNLNLLRSGERSKHPGLYFDKPTDVDFVKLLPYQLP